MVGSISVPLKRNLALLLIAVCGLRAQAELFQLPTTNRALFEKGGEERFFVGTVGKTWTSGTFGCVRSDGFQMHEGLDIRCLQRDRRGEPIDPVNATADGTVAYINKKPSLSNYGNYIILKHQVEGMEIYSVYAHLHSIREGLNVGQAVKAGENIAVMGRTANTHEGISKDRAHVHYELNVLLNDRYAEWHRKNLPGQRNDHGNWNGQNLNGIDPRLILLAQQQEGKNFSLVHFIQSETELCRVFVRNANFQYLKRYAPLITHNPTAEKLGIVGYEMALDYNGVPINLIPRSTSEIKGNGRFLLLSVNEAEQKKNPARHLVVKKGSRWELTTHGENLLDLLTF
ncbi:M23 family metallopeptidase [Pedosphaera parvula]|uniref:Peptidase M23 n=1 Tax=Pedosphaera parvula (strain Ellin514) TaxID=320771 RepID=B9XP85_PEDPL|nr:M23 family metallopeptidase [Pedosphaera parvula]EEF58336.1 Peptidase M23 [Pedosphaera parvula Ellin514]